MKVCFVGAFNQDFDKSNAADSPAGNQVQSKIIEELTIFFGKDTCYSLIFNPLQSWPHGPLVFRSKNYKKGIAPGYLNITVLKTILFSFRLFGYLYKHDVDLVVKYNVSFPESIALRLIKYIKKNIFLCIIIQDVNYPQRGLKKVHGLFEWCAVRLCSGFDLSVPITSSIIKDFKLPVTKSYVFNGGITRQTEVLIERSRLKQQDFTKESYAVFAGALEEYNGIDLLIEKWLSSNIQIKLHIFGKGSLSSVASSAASMADSIIYHGFVSEKEVNRWLFFSSFNICLRFSKGISADYYFPSKFFNFVAAQGAVVANNFTNFPESLKPLCSIVDNDLGNLSLMLKCKDITEHNNNYNKRIKWLETHCQWSSVVEECNKHYVKKQESFI